MDVTGDSLAAVGCNGTASCATPVSSRPVGDEAVRSFSEAHASGTPGGEYRAVPAESSRLRTTLMMLPGRQCENGKPVPIDDEAYRTAAEGLIAAGQAAYKAARAKDQDAADRCVSRQKPVAE